jgi:hypothetical protein
LRVTGKKRGVKDKLQQRSKHTRQFCSSCRAETRMMLVGEMPSEVEGESTGKVWYRCGKCRQVFLLDLVALGRQQELEARKIDVKDCTEYAPTKTYQLGEAIFHTEWSDVGKVKAKERTSNGGQAIVVENGDSLRISESKSPDPLSKSKCHKKFPTHHKAR